MSAAPAPVAPGDVLAGKYRVERILGKGGMGMVVAALHLQLDKRVALKFLLPEVAGSAEIHARFSREARAASKIESEHVAKVLDVGTLENGMPFMVMEYLEGQDLAQIVKQRGALPGQEAVEYVLQACEALAEAHKAGIVHRDLKPANLFLTHRADGSPCVKVLDFGISKIALAGDQGQGMTQTSALMGSPNYMAPEQLRSARNVDARTDIWALGIILQELLTGDVAFKADTVPELYVSILQAPPIPLRSRRPDAPPQMESIVARCLDKDPARRFANVGELATALADLAPARAQLSVERINRVLGNAPAPSPPKPMVGAHGTTPITPMRETGTAARPAQPSYGQPPANAPSYPPPGPAYAQSVAQAPSPAPAYGRGVTFGQQAGPGGFAPPYSPPMPMTPGYANAQPARQGMSPAAIALIIIVAAIVVVFGSCSLCLCIGAANSAPQQHRRRGALDVAPAFVHPLSAAFVTGVAELERHTQPGAFQRPAGWTTVSSGARSRPQPDPRTGRARAAIRPTTATRARRGRALLGTRGAGHGRGLPRLLRRPSSPRLRRWSGSGGGNRIAGP